MPDEARLREQAQQAIRRGQIPSRAHDRMWGGPGVGAKCAVCGIPVTKAELEIQIEFARNDSEPDLDKYHLHVRCFAAWEFERNHPPRP